MNGKSHSEQAGIIVLGKVLAALADTIVLLAIVRLLGKAEVGVLTALLLVYQTVALIATAGFPGAVLYFLPTRTRGERRALAWMFSKTLLGLGLIAGLLLASIGLIDVLFPGAFSEFAEGDAELSGSLRYLILLAAWPLADLPVRILPNLLIVEGRVRASAGVGIIKTIGMSIATLVPIALGLDLWVVMACIVVYGFAYGALLPLYLGALYRRAERVPSPVTRGELFRFALPLGFTDIVGILNQRVDRYLILLVFTASALAEYQVGAWQIPFVVTIPFAVGQVYTPHFRKLFEEGKPREAIDIWRLSIRKVSLLVVPITMVFIVAAEEVIELLATENYARAADVFRCYSLLSIGRVTAFGGVIVAAGRPGLVARAAIAYLLANLVISVPLVFTVGFLGPAIGTALAFIPGAAMYCYYIARASGVPLSGTFPMGAYLRVLGVALLAAVPAVAFKLTFDLHPAVMLGIEAAILLSVFAVVGSIARLIQREDWRYVADWVRLRSLKD